MTLKRQVGTTCLSTVGAVNMSIILFLKNLNEILIFKIETLLYSGHFFTVGICRMVLHAFKQSLYQLEGKTRLELKILHQDSSFWEVVLRSKLVQMSQKFSTQATSRTSFQEAEIRSAYVGTYCCSHASLVRAAVKSGCFPPLLEFIQAANESKRYVTKCIN